MLRIILASLLVSYGICSLITVRTNTTSEVYITVPSGDATLGYTFLLEQNVFTVRLNATKNSSRVTNATFLITPNYFLEYNQTYTIQKTSSVRSFLDFRSNEADWGAGLVLSRRTADVYQLQSVWTDPARKPLKFIINCYMSNTVTKYQGIDLKPYEVAMFFSIVDFPFILEQSALGYNQILLTGQPIQNSTYRSSIVLSSSTASSLTMDTTAIVDGKDQPVSQTVIENGTPRMLISGSKNTDIFGLRDSEVLLTFGNSYRAKNVTFQQRLLYNTSSSEAISSSTENSGNSSGFMESNTWTLIFYGILVMALNSLL